MRKLRRKKEFEMRILSVLLSLMLIFNTLFFGVSVEKVSADTTTKTFSFTTTAESFVGTAGAESTLSYDSGTGNPAGALKSRTLGRNKVNDNYWEWTGTWEDLGVPAGGTVTQIRVNAGYTQCTEFNVADSFTAGPYELRDSTGTLIATLWSGRTGTAADGSWITISAQADQNVTAGNQASSTTVKLRMNSHMDNANDAAAAISVYDDEVSFVITYTAAVPTFTLNAYRWYVDPDTEDVSDAWGNPDIAQNTAITVTPPTNDPPDSTQELRLRTNFTVNTANLPVTDTAFKLQFKAGTDGSCTTGSWTDVGAGQAWNYATSTVTDGIDLTVSRISPVSDVLEEYIKSNPTGTNPNSATVGQEIEYDFHIVGGSAFADATQYSFKVIESDATVFDAYTNCPTLSTEPGMADLMRHGASLNAGVEHGFWWVD